MVYIEHSNTTVTNETNGTNYTVYETKNDHSIDLTPPNSMESSEETNIITSKKPKERSIYSTLSNDSLIRLTTEDPVEEDVVKKQVHKKSTKSCKIDLKNHEMNQSPTEIYYAKVEQLRKDLEKTISSWMLSSRKQVNNTFYEAVRDSFELFMKELENYRHLISHKDISNKTDAKFISCHSKVNTENTCHLKKECSFTEHACKKYVVKETPTPLSNALILVNSINQRLKNLLNLLSTYKKRNELYQIEKKKERIEATRNKPENKGTHASTEEVKHLLKYVKRKLKKYNKKYGNQCQNKDIESNDCHSHFNKSNNKQIEVRSKRNIPTTNHGEHRPIRLAVWMRTVPHNEMDIPPPYHYHENVMK